MRGPSLRLAAWIDPATGKLIDSGLSTAPLLRWAHIFHGSLQIPGSGRAVTRMLCRLLGAVIIRVWLHTRRVS